MGTAQVAGWSEDGWPIYARSSLLREEDPVDGSLDGAWEDLANRVFGEPGEPQSSGQEAPREETVASPSDGGEQPAAAPQRPVRPPRPPMPGPVRPPFPGQS